MPEVVRVDAVLLEGWLEKRSRQLRVWRKRWVVLTRDGVLTFKDSSHAICTPARKPTDALLFAKGLEVKAVGARKYDRENTIEFCCDGHVFPFAADSLGDRDKWLRAINGAPSDCGPTQMADSHNDIDELVKCHAKISWTSDTTRRGSRCLSACSTISFPRSDTTRASDSEEEEEEKEEGWQADIIESAKVDSDDVDSDGDYSDDDKSGVEVSIRYLPLSNQEGQAYLERQGDGTYKVTYGSGVAYRKSPNLTDRDTSRTGPEYGAIVVGQLSNGWLKLSVVLHKLRPAVGDIVLDLLTGTTHAVIADSRTFIQMDNKLWRLEQNLRIASRGTTSTRVLASIDKS